MSEIVLIDDNIFLCLSLEDVTAWLPCICDLVGIFISSDLVSVVTKPPTLSGESGSI